MTPEQIAEMRDAASHYAEQADVNFSGYARDCLLAAAKRITALADALEAERARCAAVARECTVAGGEPITDKAYNMACEYIAKAIESGEQP